MRVLAVPILTPDSPQVGLRDALRSLAGEDGVYQEFDWFPYYNLSQIRAMRIDFRKCVEEFKPDFTFIQLQTSAILSEAEFKAIPGFKLQWSGDCRQPTPAHYIETADYFNVTTFTNELDVKVLRGKGKKADFLNTGFSPTVFRPLGEEGRFGIVFLGNNYRMFPLSQQRLEMVELLRRQYGSDFWVYGRNWPFPTTWLDETNECKIYNTCEIAIAQNHFDDIPRFASDRILRAMGSGAFVLHNAYPGIEKDFKVGVHLDVWHDFSELVEKIDYYRSHEEQRQSIAAAGCMHVHKNHSWGARVKTIRRLMEKYGS